MLHENYTVSVKLKITRNAQMPGVLNKFFTPRH